MVDTTNTCYVHTKFNKIIASTTPENESAVLKKGPCRIWEGNN